jgi:hypothetical protein
MPITSFVATNEVEHHCPFLNRSDARCSDAFSLESLEHTYQYCFGRYKACPTYLELLVERRLRRSAAAVAAAARVQRNPDANRDESTPPAEERPAQAPRYVPLTVSVNPSAIGAALAHGHAQRAA